MVASYSNRIASSSSLPLAIVCIGLVPSRMRSGRRPEMDEARIEAVILDLDGTLLDTERGTEGVLKEFLARYGKVLDPEKELRRLGKMHAESAAAIVIDYGLPLTAEEFSEKIIPMYQERWSQVKPLPGANRLVKHLHKHGVPLALASNSVRKNVHKKISYQQGWKESFSVILGGDEVNHGKPSPDIYLESAKMMGVDPSRCLVIEDSLVGVTAAKAAGMKVVAIPSIPFQGDDFAAANCVLHSLLEFQPDQWGLPAFQDWVQSTLPIEIFCVIGVLRDGDPQGTPVLMEHSPEDNPTAPLPIPASGVFFGWAMLGTRGTFKVVASIQWDFSPGGARKLIRPYVLTETSSDTPKERLRLLFVGFIRKLHIDVRTKEGSSTTSAVTEEDKRVAAAALDHPAYADHKGNPFLAEPPNRFKAYS